MVTELAMCFIEKFNDLIDNTIPEEERNEERIRQIKVFASLCFEAGFKVGFDVGNEMNYDAIEHTEQEKEEVTVN